MLPISTMPTDNVREIKSSLLTNLEQLKSGKVLVVGDLCLDEYIMGQVGRISPEAPVPVLDVESREFRLGLAAYVAQNVISLGGECKLVGVIGNDSTAGDFRSLLTESGLSDDCLIKDDTRPTTRKTRVMAGSHHIVRVDFEKRQFLSPQTEKLLLNRVRELIPDVGVVVIEDYAKGVFSEIGTQEIIALAQSLGKPVLVDPHRSTPIKYYRGADLIKPNKEEAFLLSGLNLDDLRENKDSLALVAEKLIESVGCKNLIVTLGKEGLVNFTNDAGEAMPTYARHTYDVTGAGDTVLASLSLGWASGFDLRHSCVLANCAAGVVVGKIGCVPCDLGELRDYLKS